MPLIPQRLFQRSVWLKIHLYLALSVGLLFAIIGLTGSISIYREELDTLFNPHLVIAKPQGQLKSLDRIIEAVKSAHPKRHGSWTLEMPRTPHDMITAWYDKPQETYFEYYAPLMVSVNPYTAEIVANRFWGKTITSWLADLHTQLRLDEPGWNSVGSIGILLIISVGSGLYLWWPGINNLVLAFRIRPTAGLKTLLFDTHRLIGFASALPLLILAFTGVNLSYPQLLETLVGTSSSGHGDTGAIIVSTGTPTDHPTTLAGAIFIARSAFPNATLRRISTPVGDSGIYRINFHQSSEINWQHPFTTVWVDHWNGQIKAVRDPAEFSAGERFNTAMWPLHTGETLGTKGRFIWFLAGLALFTLYITGVFIWLLRTHRLHDKTITITALRTYAVRISQTSKKIQLIVLKTLYSGTRKILTQTPKQIRTFLNNIKKITSHPTSIQCYESLLTTMRWLYLKGLVLFRQQKRLTKKD